MESLTLLLLLVLKCSIVNTGLPTKTCPEGCVCVQKAVKCYALTDFPTWFPPLTTYIYMDEMNVQTIPPDSLNGLQFLTKVEFHRGNFGSIPTCGYKSIKSLEKIIFVKTVIGHMDTFSIYNISGPLTIEFIQCKITKISSFAMTTLPNIVSLKIHETTIYEIGTLAFTNITIQDLSIFDSVFKKVHQKPFMIEKNTNANITGNVFEDLPCGIFDDVMPSKGGNVEITGNGVQCDCGIGYIMDMQNNERKQLVSDMYCLKDGKINQNQKVSDVLGGPLPCEQQRKPEVTKCQTAFNIAVPMIMCPAHGHESGGHQEIHNNKADNHNGGDRARTADFVLTLLFSVFIIL